MANPILYINACVRKESRTAILAQKLLKKLEQPYDEVRLEGLTFPTVNEDYLGKRDKLISEGDFNNSMFDLARRFAEAECIVIAAPFWDLSFPAMLKQYLELVNVVGITFRYSEEGIPIGLCKASRIFYVTTAGGNFVPKAYGFEYVKALAQSYYGIEDVRLIKAVGLDIYGADVDAIMRSAEDAVENMKID
ncbi:NAD(P)H-dependent oxidoreductase [Butyrivibrio sp. WCE2006]|uniref:NAD(P)H-dependent oxidoreductase n=1 Tax=Butyrivibrio sp. WCE2006 TaxID=1410611 RepID=UPI0005D18B64|nr:NAD(P)H-dependent oxidoreductase [Butyrivibrio sp. WCE2006]